MPVDSLDFPQFPQSFLADINHALLRQPATVRRTMLWLERCNVDVPEIESQGAEVNVVSSVREVATCKSFESAVFNHRSCKAMQEEDFGLLDRSLLL